MEGEGKTIQISPEGKLEVSGAPSIPAAFVKEVPRVVRTFESDLATVMREKKGSVISIALAEERRRQASSEATASPKKNFLLVFLSVAALAFGAGLLVLVYFGNDEEPLTETAVTPLIFVEKQTKIPAEGISQARMIALVGGRLTDETLRLDTMEHIYFTEGTVAISTERFFSLLGTRVPPVLLRSLKEEFMLGVHAFNGNQPFLIFKTDFYENAFLGLLKWERTLAADLLPLFGVNIGPENRYLLEKDFVDATVKNRDARALIDQTGRTVLLYAIPNKETIVISAAEDTLDEVVRRLSAPGR